MLDAELLAILNQIPAAIEKAFINALVLRHPGHGNQKTHGNRYGGFSTTKESLRRLKDDKGEREKYKGRARKKIGAKPKSQPEKTKGPAGTPVSEALNTAKLPKGGNTGPKVRETLAVIDSVHGDGALPEIPINVNGSKAYFGFYKYYPGGSAKDIAVSRNSTHPMITTAHEVGHFLDHKGGFSNAPNLYGDFASRGRGKSPEMDSLLGAIGKSKAYSSLDSLKGKEVEIEYTNFKGDKAKAKVKLDNKHIAYLQRPAEAFARGYSQYIAVKSQHPGMLSELNEIRSKNHYTDQWADDDFAPIGKAFDALFESKGYIK